MLKKEEVLHIAKLARLELTEQETTKMQKDLSAILDYFNLLKKVKKLAPAKKGAKVAHLDIEKVTRKDRVIEKPASLANNLVQSAPDKKEGYIKVKAIL